MSKKRRHGKRKDRRKQKRNEPPQITPGLLAKLQHSNLPAAKIRTSDEMSMPRLSERVWRVAEALREELGRPYAPPEAFVEPAILGWNLSLFPSETRRRVLRESLPGGNTAPLEHLVLRAIVKAALWWKLRLFPDDRRFVVSFDLRETKDGYTLNVASTLLPEGFEKEGENPDARP